jgi:hypothetical protein
VAEEDGKQLEDDEDDNFWLAFAHFQGSQFHKNIYFTGLGI